MFVVSYIGKNGTVTSVMFVYSHFFQNMLYSPHAQYECSRSIGASFDNVPCGCHRQDVEEDLIFCYTTLDTEVPDITVLYDDIFFLCDAV